MQLQEARLLIKKAVAAGGPPQTWADLGAGRGLFSHALLSILPAGSIVHAIDVEEQDFHDYPSVIFHRANFARDTLSLPPLDGILMANSLHYVKDQLACVQRLKTYLKNNDRKFILVEYDTDRGNRWVPFPISFSRARKIFSDAGFASIEEIGERPSVYRSDPIYAALISEVFHVPNARLSPDV